MLQWNHQVTCMRKRSKVLVAFDVCLWLECWISITSHPTRARGKILLRTVPTNTGVFLRG